MLLYMFARFPFLFGKVLNALCGNRPPGRQSRGDLKLEPTNCHIVTNCYRNDVCDGNYGDDDGDGDAHNDCVDDDD